MKEQIDSNSQVLSPVDLDGMMKDEGEAGNLANQLNFISQADAKDVEEVVKDEKKTEDREEDQVDTFGEKLNLISRPGTEEKATVEKITSDLQENCSNFFLTEELNSITKTDDELDNNEDDKETEFENNETSIVENLNFIAQPDGEETNDADAEDSDLSIDSSSKEEEQVLASTLAFISQQKQEASEDVAKIDAEDIKVDAAKIDAEDIKVDAADELKFISQPDGEETHDNDTEDADLSIDSSNKEEEQVLASTLAFISQQKQEASEDVAKIDAEDIKVDAADELKFISQPDGEETHDNDTEDADLISIGGEGGVALASTLAFISQSEELLQYQKGKEDVAKIAVAAIDVTEKEEKAALASTLAFISQSKRLPREQKEETTKMDATDVLKFISKPDPEGVDIAEEEGVDSKLDEPSLIDELNILSKSSLVKEKQGPTLKTDGSQTKTQRMPTATDTNIPENSSARRATNTTHQSHIKHIIALIAFSVIAILMTFAYLRIGLQVFCPYDAKLNTYVVMEKVEQCPVPTRSQSDDDDESCPFWKKCPDSIEGLVEYVPAPVGKRHEILCRGTFNVLHTVAALLHPSINYRKTMPQVHMHSPCPEIPVKKKKKHIFQRIFPGKQRTDSKINAADSSGSGDGSDWSLYVSAPFDLDLPPKHIELARKVTENLKRSLATKYPQQVNEKDWFDQKMENAQFGGSFPWWHPVKDKWGKEKEDSGLRLVAAYLKIMDWPEVRRINLDHRYIYGYEEITVLTMFLVVTEFANEISLFRSVLKRLSRRLCHL